MTFDASSANVLATIPPQPRSKDRAITLPFVPGGPEPSTNGLSNFMPLTVMLRSVTSPPGWTPGKPETAGLAQADSAIQWTFIWMRGHRHIHLTGVTQPVGPAAICVSTPLGAVLGLRRHGGQDHHPLDRRQAPRPPR